MALTQSQEQQLLRLLARFSGEGSTDTKYNTLQTVPVSAGAEVRAAEVKHGSVSKDAELLLMNPDGTPRRITLETLSNVLTNVNINVHQTPRIDTAHNNFVKGGQVTQYVSNEVQTLNNTINSKVSELDGKINSARQYALQQAMEVKKSSVQGFTGNVQIQIGATPAVVGTSRINLPKWVLPNCWLEAYFFDREYRGRIRAIMDGTNRFVMAFELHDTYSGLWMCIGSVV